MQRDTRPKIYEFCGFRLESAQHRLLYEGKAVPLKPKVLDLLRFLIERRGELIVKEDLMKEIWPGTIVEENNITVSMSILRKTLGEGRKSLKFIETVPRRGYRFVAEVVEIPIEETTERDDREFTCPTEPPKERIDSLAILPVEGAGKDFSTEYLSDGITACSGLQHSFSLQRERRRPAGSRYLAQCQGGNDDSGDAV
jgi:DNA-binding winged helix-turn-helix (wHTH) protein